MSTVIRFKRKTSTGNNNVDLLAGEPYINLTDHHFYICEEDGKVPDKAVNEITKQSAANDTIKFQVGTSSSNIYEKKITDVANAYDLANLKFEQASGTKIKLTWGPTGKQKSTTFNVEGSISGVIDKAANVTDAIAGHPINSIFEDNGTTAKNATNATNAVNATNATQLTTSAGSATTPVYFKDGKPVSTNVDIVSLETKVENLENQLTWGSF